ncbi:DinB family protein [Streptomyces angustmyceticus]|uniref:DinB family protein n=1 Tax=Streptomyces angustmyceticus TaxID=285578 RepID=UPI0021B031B8|nr:DinB family protein [Streptomyces angustmyceticus]
MEFLAEPPMTLTAPDELMAEYLDFYRDTVLRKLDGLSDEELRRSRVPSGWAPLELLKHLAHVEMRWLQWGFSGETVSEPWGDMECRGGRWRVGPEETFDELRAFFREQCERSREIVAEASWEDRAASLGGEVPPEDERPALGWILFHLLQEYARHVGHLDIARELADGGIGE